MLCTLVVSFSEWRNCRCIVSLKFRLGESQNEQSFILCYQSRECILNQEKRFCFFSSFFCVSSGHLFSSWSWMIFFTDGNRGHCVFCVLSYVYIYIFWCVYACVRVCIHPSRYACERYERRIQRRRRRKQNSGENSLVFLALHCLSYGCLCFCSMLFDSVCLLYFIAVRYLYIHIYIYTRLKQEVHLSSKACSLFDTRISLCLLVFTLSERMDFTNMLIEPKASRHARLLSHRCNVPVQGIFISIVPSIFQMLIEGEWDAS